MHKLVLSVLGLGISQLALGQLSGTKTIDPTGSGANNYPSFAAAVTALAAGVGPGGVTFQVKSGTVFEETIPALTVAGTATAPVRFQKNGTGANPRLQSAGTGATDAAITLDGATYVTFDGIDVVDRSANTTAEQQLEYGFWLKGGASNNTISNSTIDLSRANTNRSYGAYVQGGGNNANRFYNNTVQDCTFGYYLDPTTAGTDAGNEIGVLPGGVSRIQNIGLPATGGPTTTTIVYGIYLRNQTGAKIFGTDIGDLSNVSSSVYGINTVGLTTVDIYDNRIHGLVANGTSAPAQAILIGAGAGSVHTVYRNYLYDVLAAGTSGFASGIDVNGGTTNNVYNNFVYDIKAPASTAGTSVRAFSFRGGTTNYAFHNTVVVNYAATAATNRSGALYISGSPGLDMRNNIFVNLVSGLPAGGGGVGAAFFKSTTALTNIAAASNNNLFYAGPPSAEKPIFYGVNATAPAVDQTLAEYKARVTPADQAAVTEAVPFVNATTNPHLLATVPTRAESGGVAIATPFPVVTDIDQEARNAARPDIGADEGNFLVLSNRGGTLTDLTVTCFPNPAAGHLIVEVAGPARPLDLTLTDVLGRPVQQHEARHPGGVSQQRVELSALHKGLYVLRITAAGETTSRAIIVE